MYLDALYQTNESVPREDEVELRRPLPDPASLLSPEQFDHAVAEFHRLERTRLTHRGAVWHQPIVPTSAEAILAIFERANAAIRQLNGFDRWLLRAVEAGRRGGPQKDVWRTLILEIRRAATDVQATMPNLIEYQPAFAPGGDLDTDAAVLERILAHVRNGGGFGRLALLTHGDWRALLSRATIHGREVRADEREIIALVTLLALQRIRRDLVRRWQAQVAAIGGPPPASLGEAPEEAADRLRPQIDQALAWWPAVWEPITLDLASHGFSWSRFRDNVTTDALNEDELTFLHRIVPDELEPVIASRARKLRLEAIGKQLQGMVDHLAPPLSADAPAEVVQALDQAIRALNTDDYRLAHQRLVTLHAQAADLRRRDELLMSLEAVAPAWAATIRDRMPPHAGSTPHGDPAAAWRWRQLHEMLLARDAVSVPALEREVEQHRVWLEENTARLIETRAWAAQVHRVRAKPGLQASLVGWRNLINRIGRGTGRRAPLLHAQARRQMDECQDAVPVWILPLNRVVDSFDPRTTRFDVVIIDEASQSDATAMAALYLGQEVIVVGDDKQVSPLAVGQDLAPVDQIIATHLRGIPNATLYDGRYSIYQMAEAHFGGVISLVEHFRCVPDIIQFSNHLSYDGALRPLRDATSVQRLPSVVAYRVEGHASRSNVNEEEALTIASLMAAAWEQPEYADATFGAITLVGDQQAIEIETRLRRHLSPTELQHRRVICGNPAQFQGDERDVIFLSMVDSPNPRGGPLPMRNQELFQQRFNVAASRARDQLWVVHSLSHETDLQPQDLRRRLIEHALDPKAVTRNLDAVLSQAESEFERQVLSRLVGAGYRVIPQFRVGAYRIDMVVEGAGRRLAVECDGDRYHTIDDLPADMERQAILERLGWTFVRVRGSTYFRDPDAAFAPVFARLTEMEIAPVGLAPVDASEMDSTDPSSDSLLERVKRRAAELRREWAATPDSGIGVVAWTPEPVRSQIPTHVPAASRPPNLASPPRPPVSRQRAPRTPQLRLPIAGLGNFDLGIYLTENGLDFIDKTRSGGAIWVIGGRELRSIMDDLQIRGVTFTFKRGGGQATKNQDAWWYKPLGQ